MLVNGLDVDGKSIKYEASHLCGNPNCIFSLHIVVEPKDYNTSRSRCHAIFFIATIIIGGQAVEIKSHCDCPHEPKCLPRRLRMSVVEETPGPAPAASRETLGLNPVVKDENFDD